MKRIIAIALLAACSAGADSFTSLVAMVDWMEKGCRGAANNEFNTLRLLDPALARSIDRSDFMMPCTACGGGGERGRACSSCKDGNASSSRGFRRECSKCDDGWVMVECSECDGTGQVLSSDAMRYLKRKLSEHHAANGSTAIAWELAKRDLQRKRNALLRSKTIRGPIAQIADGGIFIIHYNSGTAIREFIVGMKLDGLYDDKLVECEAWPIGTHTYTSVLGASITVQKFTVNLWSEW